MKQRRVALVFHGHFGLHRKAVVVLQTVAFVFAHFLLCRHWKKNIHFCKANTKTNMSLQVCDSEENNAHDPNRPSRDVFCHYINEVTGPSDDVKHYTCVNRKGKPKRYKEVLTQPDSTSYYRVYQQGIEHCCTYETQAAQDACYTRSQERKPRFIAYKHCEQSSGGDWSCQTFGPVSN